MSGSIQEYTTNYKFEIPSFDFPNWHTYYARTLKTIDSMFYQVTGSTNLKGAWQNSTAYVIGDRVIDTDDSTTYVCLVDHTSAASPDTFADERTDQPTYWSVSRIGPAPRGDWVTATLYFQNDFVQHGNQYYVCEIQHTSGTFATDLAASKWTLLLDGDAITAAGVADATAQATAAAASASDADDKATDADNSATAAAGSASAAATSEANAADYAVAAQDSVGLKYQYSTTTTMGDPSAGGIRFNNATIASATAIAISRSTLNSGNPNVGVYIDSWDDSTSDVRGHLTIRKVGAPDTFAIFRITGTNTDNTTWKQITVTYDSGNGTLSNGDDILITFDRTGDAGTGDMNKSAYDPDSDGIIAVAQGGTGSANASGARTNLGLIIGTNVQAYHANLTALAGLTGAAGKIPAFSGAGAMANVDYATSGANKLLQLDSNGEVSDTIRSSRWATISTQSPTSGTVVTFTGLSTYSDLMVIIDSLVLANGSAVSITLSNDGTNFTANSVTLGTFGTAAKSNAAILLGARSGAGVLLTGGTVMSVPAASTPQLNTVANAGVTTGFLLTGAITAIKLTSGQAFVSGNITVKGR